ncbi:MAG: EF-hand domain-containing protein [Methylotenera sp.]|jgi:Ca2+-binding EF-hand superfamily protein
MKNTISTILILSIMVLGVLTAYANHHEGGETEKHEMSADTDNDGKVSYEEFKNARMKYMDEHFKRRDTNGDGYIDADEKKAARAKMKARHHDKEHCDRK